MVFLLLLILRDLRAKNVLELWCNVSYMSIFLPNKLHGIVHAYTGLACMCTGIIQNCTHMDTYHPARTCTHTHAHTGMHTVHTITHTHTHTCEPTNQNLP